jgi:hypothetical protein
MLFRRLATLTGLVALAVAAAYAGDPPPAGPAYRIVLRSRRAVVTPARTRQAQTGGGSIVVEEPEPGTVVVTMGGSAVVGSDCHGSSAGMTFDLDQELEIVPTRLGVRPPRIGLVGRVVGTLQVTDPSKCCIACKACGTAAAGPAVACLSVADTGLLTVSVPPASVACGQELAINHREGPVEAPAVAGCYHLHGSFRIDVSQEKGVFHRQFAVADFDPSPELSAFWADALKPFRAVPRSEFGFKFVLRVVEDAAP